MSQITLIRHGQANTDARDETSYDRLSELGRRQSAWLGEHLKTSAAAHARLFCGTLRRHVETAEAMALGRAMVDPRLNELEYFTLARLLEEQHGVAVPAGREDFVGHLPQVFSAWAEGRIDGAPESFEAFEARVQSVLSEIAGGEGPALVVTSGGLIAMAMRQVLDLGVPAMSRMTLAIMNTSIHQLFPIGDALSPVLFNAVPHLDHPERHFARTHV